MPERRGAGRIRVFFALWPDETVAERLYRLGGDAHACCGGRQMRRDTLHLTLAFIGDIPRARLPALAAVADGVRGQASSLSIDHCGYWRHNRIVWAGSHQPPAALTGFGTDFADALRAAGFDVERRPFTPHVTLLRNARCGAPPPDPEPIVWPIESFVLVASVLSQDGSRYRVLARWPLAK